MRCLHSDKSNAFVLFLPFLVLPFIIQSCSFNPFNYTYIQTPVHVSDLQKKGDLRVDGYVWVNHADAHVSYAVSNRFGVIAGYNQGFKNAIHYGELGLGYFSSSEQKLRFGLFAGAGVGSVSVDYKITRERLNDELFFDLNSQYNKFFIQPSIGYQLSRKVLLSGTFRLNYVNYQSYSYFFEDYSIDSSGNKMNDPNNWSYHYETIGEQGVWIFDPSSTITVNVLRNMSFTGTLNYSMPLWTRADFQGSNNLMSAFLRPEKEYDSATNEKFNHPLYSNLAIHIGLRFRMNTNKKTITSKE